MTLEIVFMFLWFAFSMLAGWVAEQKGRSGVGFFFLSLILTPVIGLIAAAIVSRNEDAISDRAISDGEMRRCPYCAEPVRIEAIKCKHCGSALPQQPHPVVANVGDQAVETRLSFQVGRAIARLFKSKQKQ